MISFHWSSNTLIYLKYESVYYIQEYSATFVNQRIFVQREGPKQWIFDELKQMQEIKFRFKEKERPMGYVIGLSRDLHVFTITILFIDLLVFSNLFSFRNTLLMSV